MLKYLTKISMDIFPSVLATIIGAYIVNHYINAKPAPDTPSAVAAPAQAAKDGKPADVANLPGPGVKAKGISERSVLDKPTAEKVAPEKAAEPVEAKAADAPAAEAPPSPRGRPSASRTAKASNAPSTSVPPTVSPAETSPSATQDANDLARAAIERLRRSPQRPTESPVQETAGVQEASRLAAPAQPPVRPLPPPITVSTPSAETYAASPSFPSASAPAGHDEASRLTPPADIPVPVIAPPLDLRADATGSVPRAKANVADEMLSGVKSMFNAVLPKPISSN